MSQPVPSLSGAIPRRFPWRRLLQFRLRSILILTTVIAAVLGWWSNRVRPQRDAVAAITVLNGRVTYDFEKQQLGGPAHWPEWLVSAIGVDCFANVVGVSLNHTRVTNADMRHLRRFPCLEELNLEGTQITESGLEHLRELIALKRIVLPMTATDAGLEKFTGHPGLQEIDLSYGFNITDAGMKHLRGHTGLQCLALQNTQITDAGLQHLQGLSLLRKLNLPGAITDTGLQQVKSLGSLEELNLRFCVLIGDPGLDHLQGLAGLQRLGLGYTKVTDAGMKKLQGLRSLRRLDLSTTAITDAGLQHLKTLTNLQELDLESSQITVAGVARFRQSLPNCEIKSYAMLVLEPDPKVLNLAKVIDLTDVDLEFIRGLTGLEELNLEGTPVTDAGLEHLKGMATLQKLHLYNTQVSDSGVARLKQTLPRCSIDH